MAARNTPLAEPVPLSFKMVRCCNFFQGSWWSVCHTYFFF
jgi:hypothetical protein